MRAELSKGGYFLETFDLGKRRLRQTTGICKGYSLWWRVVHKFDPLIDIALEPCLARFKKLLLILVYLS